MGSTTRYQWPYPEESDPPDVPADIGDLARSVELTIGTLDDRLTNLDGVADSVFQITILARTSSNLQNIPTSTWTPVSFDTQQLNVPQAMPGFTLTSPTRITCHQRGYYRISGFAGIQANGTGSRGVAVRVNGSVSTSSSYPAIQSGNGVSDMPWYGSVNVEALVNKDDFLELVVRQASGSTLKMDAVYPRFSMQRIF